MQETSILPLGPSSESGVLALNQASVVETSPLDGQTLQRLAAEAFYARVIGRVDAFLLAFDQAADYSSPNFLWFKQRHRRFVYVDRVVVATQARGRGLARLLYTDLFRCARAAGHDRIVCEVNIDPPNPASDSFHARLGFAEQGRGTLPGSGKLVRYLCKEL